MDRKNKILRAAIDEFTDKGYHLARVRDICAKAKANLAAINYYFGGKEALYREVIEFVFNIPDPFDLAVKDHAHKTKPEEYLLSWIEAFLENTSSESPLYKYRYKIIMHEMVSPSPLLPEIMEHKMIPRLAKLKEIVRKLKGSQAPDDEISALCLLTLGQCIYFFNKPMVEGFTGRKDFVSKNVKLIAGKIIKTLTN
jgi:AcrR family transcriptional regulator